MSSEADERAEMIERARAWFDGLRFEPRDDDILPEWLANFALSELATRDARVAELEREVERLRDQREDEIALSVALRTQRDEAVDALARAHDEAIEEVETALEGWSGESVLAGPALSAPELVTRIHERLLRIVRSLRRAREEQRPGEPEQIHTIHGAGGHELVLRGKDILVYEQDVEEHKRAAFAEAARMARERVAAQAIVTGFTRETEAMRALDSLAQELSGLAAEHEQRPGSSGEKEQAETAGPSAGTQGHESLNVQPRPQAGEASATQRTVCQPEGNAGAATRQPAVSASPSAAPREEAETLERAAEILKAHSGPGLWSITERNVRWLAAQLRAAPQDVMPPARPQDWTEDWPHENGRYVGKCSSCGREFYGHKRRVTCRICAAPQAAQETARYATVCGELDATERAAVEEIARSGVRFLELKRRTEGERRAYLHGHAAGQRLGASAAAKYLGDSLDEVDLRSILCNVAMDAPAPAPPAAGDVPDVFYDAERAWYRSQRARPVDGDLAALLRARFGPAMEALEMIARHPCGAEGMLGQGAHCGECAWCLAKEETAKLRGMTT